MDLNERAGQELLARSWATREQLAWAYSQCQSQPQLDLLEILQKHGVLSPAQVLEVRAQCADHSQTVLADTVSGSRSLDHTAALSRSNPSMLSQQGDIGPYTIIRELGRGGMGLVYHARHASLDREVALKVLEVDEHQAEAAERFEIEARAMARLRHPNILPIFEVGAIGGRAFIAMQLADQSLDTIICENGALTVKRALEITEQLALGLHHAHSQSIVHRDMKPANVLLGHQGEVMIADFGLAKVLGQDQGLSRTGSVMGTPAYMPPEQVEGIHSRIDGRADVYSLGATLFEMLCAKPPFEGQTFENILVAVLSKAPPSLGQHRSDVPKDLETLMTRCLAKEPESRYQSAQELAVDCRHILNGEPIEARPVGFVEGLKLWRRRNPTLAWVLLGSALLVMALALVTGLLLLRSSRRNARLAVERFTKTRELAKAYLYKVDDQLKQLPGSQADRRQLADLSLQYLKGLITELGQDFELRREVAQAYRKLGDILGGDEGNLARFDAAREAYKTSQGLIEELLRQRPEDPLLRSEQWLCGVRVLRLLEQQQQFSKLQLQAEALLKDRPKPKAGAELSLDLRRGLNDLLSILESMALRQDKLKAAQAYQAQRLALGLALSDSESLLSDRESLRSALESSRLRLASHPENIAQQLETLRLQFTWAFAEKDRSRDRALTLMREVKKDAETLKTRVEHPEIDFIRLQCHFEIGTLLEFQDRYEEARELFKAALSQYQASSFKSYVKEARGRIPVHMPALKVALTIAIGRSHLHAGDSQFEQGLTAMNQAKALINELLKEPGHRGHARRLRSSMSNHLSPYAARRLSYEEILSQVQDLRLLAEGNQDLVFSDRDRATELITLGNLLHALIRKAQGSEDIKLRQRYTRRALELFEDILKPYQQNWPEHSGLQSSLVTCYHNYVSCSWTYGRTNKLDAYQDRLYSVLKELGEKAPVDIRAVQSRYMGMRLFHRGDKLKAQEAFEQSAACYRQWSRSEALSFGAWQGLGMCETNLGALYFGQQSPGMASKARDAWREARECFRKMLEMKPQSAQVMIFIGESHSNSGQLEAVQGQRLLALNHYLLSQKWARRGLKIQPDSAAAKKRLAVLEAKIKPLLQDLQNH